MNQKQEFKLHIKTNKTRHNYNNTKVMKKRLEADLISIAHRVLQLKNKSDINQLYLESQKLYEKLSVLRFIDAHYGDVKPTIGQAAALEDMERFYDKEEELPAETEIEMNEENLHQDETPEEIETVEETEVIESAEQEDEVEEEPTIVPEKEIEEAPIEEEIEIEEEQLPENEEEEITPEIAEVNPDFEADIKEEQEVSEHVEELAEETPTEEILVPEEDEEDEETANEHLTAVEKVIDDEISAEETAEVVNEPIIEEKKEESIFSFTPSFENNKPTEEPARLEAVQISFEDLLGLNYGEPQFVKVEDVAPLAPEPIFDPIEEKSEVKNVITELPRTISREHAITETANTPPPIFEKSEEMATPLAKSLSLNDKFSKGIDIDLNDRIAFVKHLFGNSEEDYNRVLNQLITFDNFYETRNFIEEMVKPDYNDWKGKDDYAERFIDIIEKKFL